MTDRDPNDHSLMHDLLNILVALAASPQARRILWISLQRHHPRATAMAGGLVILMAICSPLMLLLPSGPNVIETAADHVAPQQQALTDPSTMINHLVEVMVGPVGYLITGMMVMFSTAGLAFGLLGWKQFAQAIVAHIVFIYAPIFLLT